jgi:hypothetical protein
MVGAVCMEGMCQARMCDALLWAKGMQHKVCDCGGGVYKGMLLTCDETCMRQTAVRHQAAVISSTALLCVWAYISCVCKGKHWL